MPSSVAWIRAERRPAAPGTDLAGHPVLAATPDRQFDSLIPQHALDVAAALAAQDGALTQVFIAQYPQSAKIGRLWADAASKIYI